MARNEGNSLRKKSREDLLLIIRGLVEENEELREQLAQTQLSKASEVAPVEISDASDEQKAQLRISLDSLRASVDACTDAILALNKTRAENE